MSDTYADDKKATSDRSGEASLSPSLLEASIGDDSKFAGIDRKSLLRRIDWRILPYTLLTYMVLVLFPYDLHGRSELTIVVVFPFPLSFLAFPGPRRLRSPLAVYDST
jgi:hypothetical protein